MDEAVSVPGLWGGPHRASGHPLERVLGVLAVDSDLYGAKAEERPVASEGGSTTTAVLVERIPPAGDSVFGNPGLLRSVARAGSPSDHREHPFAGIH